MKRTPIVEIFKPVYIDGEKSQYIVSDYGTVINARTNKKIKPQKFKNSDYWYVNLYQHGIMHRYTLHRLVADNFIENPENKPTVNHIIPGKEGKEDNSVFNLEWSTYPEQHDHRDRTGMTAKGEKHGNSKIKDKQIHEICKLLMNHVSSSEIAEMHNVSEAYISSIRNHKTRKDITNQYKFPKTEFLINGQYSYDMKLKIKELILDGKKNKEIYQIMNLQKDNKTRNMIDRIRKKLKSND